MSYDQLLLPDRAVLTLAEPITLNSRRRIHQQIASAIDHYHYSRIELRIASPGGEWQALLGILADMRSWRIRRSVSFSTRAIGDVASAAAVLLALGDIGRRSADPEARVLLHDPRVRLADRKHGDLSPDEISWIFSDLQVARTMMTHRLTDHVWPALFLSTPADFVPHSWGFIHDRFASLVSEERWLSADDAVQMHIVDRISSLSLGEISTQADEEAV